MNEYQRALESAMAKQASRRLAQKYDLRARELLRSVGYSATREQLVAFAEHPDSNIEEEHRAATVERAIELQNDESFTGRRLSAEEVELAPRTMTGEVRTAILAYVRERRAADPSLIQRAVLAEVEKKFRVKISPQNFHATYWTKITKEIAAGEPPQKRAAASTAAPTTTVGPLSPQPAASTDAPAAPPVAMAAPVTATKAATAAEVIPAAAGDAYFALTPLTDGRTFVQLRVSATPFAAGLLAQVIGSALAQINMPGRAA